MTKENIKELSEYDRWLLFQTRQDSNFCFCSDVADHLQIWLKKNRKKTKFKVMDKTDDDVYDDMLDAFRKSCEARSKEKILYGLSLFLSNLLNDIQNNEDLKLK